MHIALTIVSCMLAIYFIVCKSKISKRWIRQSFMLYGVIFAGTALLIGGIYIKENKPNLIASAMNLFPKTMIEPAAAKTSQVEESKKIKQSVHLKAPQINQLPELPRGCEVTSLSMLLNYHDIKVDKMKLADQIQMDPTPYKKTDKGIYFGDPNDGFVGDMYSFTAPGLGVYHQPISELAGVYAGERVLDFTGQDFDEIIQQLNQERPVLVIINATYKKLSKQQFMTWQTPNGPVKVTMREHSVLVTGYDQDFIYFNDPLDRRTKAPIDDFKAAWEQMGKQAITIW
ncbi:C39 family peptidase [Lentibacillus sp. N15]|uniref:C39 family peptidase n=1 Tax=Lentibacillus songyuanensis TaxID=3136161 RepID=UPI0031BA44CA